VKGGADFGRSNSVRQFFGVQPPQHQSENSNSMNLKGIKETKDAPMIEAKPYPKKQKNFHVNGGSSMFLSKTNKSAAFLNHTADDSKLN
jgi:hypothetical protein